MKFSLLVFFDERLEVFYNRPKIVAFDDLELQLVHVDLTLFIQLRRRNEDGLSHIRIPSNRVCGSGS